MKVTVIGAGNVGALTAMRLIEHDLCDIVLIDIVDGMAKGKAEDIMDAASVVGFSKTVTGTTDFAFMEGSDLVIITAGLARKPGMTREELLKKNAFIVGDTAEKIHKHASMSIIITITNPLDAMTYIAYKHSGFSPQKVLGMAGLLDSSRMNLLLSRITGTPISQISSLVLGTHGETMVPALSQSKIHNKQILELLDKPKCDQTIFLTKNRGAELISYLRTTSAFFAPSACVVKMALSILKDKKEVIPASCYLTGEYGITDLYLGVPAVLGKNGVEKIIELDLSEEEKEALLTAAGTVKRSIEQAGV